ncbi:hypothetical protein AALB16_15240 [Lachnospiraceae bacterium 62-35]
MDGGSCYHAEVTTEDETEQRETIVPLPCGLDEAGKRKEQRSPIHAFGKKSFSMSLVGRGVPFIDLL